MSASKRITDEDILIAMQQQLNDTPEAAARRVVQLFAQRVGRRLSEEEIADNVRRVLGVVRLPLRQVKQCFERIHSLSTLFGLAQWNGEQPTINPMSPHSATILTRR